MISLPDDPAEHLRLAADPCTPAPILRRIHEIESARIQRGRSRYDPRRRKGSELEEILAGNPNLPKDLLAALAALCPAALMKNPAMLLIALEEPLFFDREDAERLLAVEDAPVEVGWQLLYAFVRNLQLRPALSRTERFLPDLELPLPLWEQLAFFEPRVALAHRHRPGIDPFQVALLEKLSGLDTAQEYIAVHGIAVHGLELDDGERRTMLRSWLGARSTTSRCSSWR